MKRRPLKVGIAIHRIIAEAIQKEITEPDAWKITITRVFITPNLRMAKVYFAFIGEEAEQEKLENILTENKPALKRALAKNLRIRFQPELEFVPDKELAQAERIEQILDDLNSPPPRPSPQSDIGDPAIKGEQ
ncbi:MAG: 30S ribosome-binding factor RbfA [Candidatus Omnitrophota bacterium]